LCDAIVECVDLTRQCCVLVKLALLIGKGGTEQELLLFEMCDLGIDIVQCRDLGS
jgi:hypothetical protein